MSYNYESIEKIIKKIDENIIYLPAIQRKFVWKQDQIYRLFDSIFRGYPIGTFLFWYISGKKRNQYTFYKFLKNYHVRERYLNEIAPNPTLRRELIGVLDGQQRLSSMYIAIQGTYAFKKPYAKRDDKSAYPKRKLYLNLLFDPNESDEEDEIYDFQFLTDEEANEIDVNCLWFPVRKVLEWGKEPEIDSYYEDLIESDKIDEKILKVINHKQKRKQIKRMIRILHQRIVIQELISYYKIDEPELDNILDIFVRVNSAGTVLSKSDLLFSTIVANWAEGREKIENLLEILNCRGDGFNFNIDFIMRSCLVLTDCPVLFKVNSFRKENIQIIMNNWEEIQNALEKAISVIVDFGFNYENLTSQNAVIPIAYYFMKGGKNTKCAKKNMHKYLVHSLLNRIYGSHGDSVLSKFREVLRKKYRNKYVLEKQEFSFDQLLITELPRDKSLEITEEGIEELLEIKKSSLSFVVLTHLYPYLKYSQIKFHQDHIFPASLFANRKLKKYGVLKSKWAYLQEIKDTLPNLQIMEGKENESKSNMPFNEWLKKNIRDISKFKRDNYIPPNIKLEHKYFENFYNKRKEILRNKLKKILL